MSIKLMKTSSPYIIVFYAHFDGVCEKKKKEERKKKAAAFVKFTNCGGVGVIMDL